ncbi:hypothetical protein KKB83_03095 [Patescibacteria group bacterium]|nr:hypothetical protein [Patescibacteria group bacterium]
MSLLNIPNIASQLNQQTREKFERVYEIRQEEGCLRLTDQMKPWVKENFGSIEVVEKQKVVRILNKITLKGASFNALRSQRPDQTHGINATLEELIQKTHGGPFCRAEEMTPEDAFGRIRGAYCITAANIAKSDIWHGVLIFHKHHPLDWEAEEITDFLATANQWFYKVHQEDSKANFPFLFWNCLWRAAASIVHGHMQMIVSSSPFAQKILLDRQTREYQGKYQSNYFADLYQIHNALGLTLPTTSPEIKAFVPICPRREREIIIMSDNFDQKLWQAFAQIIVDYRNKLGVKSFNVGLTPLPLNGEPQLNLPVIIEIIDRGDLSSNHSEIGSMEMFAQQVITHDPFETKRMMVS